MRPDLLEMSEESCSTGHVDDPGPGVEDGEEDVADGLVGPVVGLHCRSGFNSYRLGLDHDPGVVDQDVNPPVLLLDEVPELDDGLLLADVQLVVPGLQPLPPEGLQGGQTSSLISGREVDVTFVLLTQRPHNGQTYALVGPCDHSYRHGSDRLFHNTQLEETGSSVSVLYSLCTVHCRYSQTIQH